MPLPTSPLLCSVQPCDCSANKFPLNFRFKVSGELPLLHVRISDQKIQSVVGLVHSVPLPSLGSAPSTPTEKVHWLNFKREWSYRVKKTQITWCHLIVRKCGCCVVGPDVRTVKRGFNQEEANFPLLWSHYLLQGPLLTEGRLQALSVNPALLHTLDSGQSRNGY